MANGVKFANNLRTDSSDYRAELLSPTPVGENHVTMASEQSWRLNMDKFHLPETSTESSCFRLGYYIKAFRRQRRLSEYYKRQEVLLKGYNEIDTFNELGILPGSLSEEETRQLVRNERVAIYASNVANFVLFLAKVYASVMSRSLAVIASTLDSLLDLLSGFILWFTAYAMRKPNQYRYPIGKNRMQPVGIIVFASVMTTLGLQILFESGRELIIKAQPDRDPVKEKWMIGIMVSVTVVKLVLLIYCRRFDNEIIKAYAQDHFFDVITNSIGLGTAVLAIKFYWWIDPLGAILIALYTMGNWANTVIDNVWGLIGTTAPPEYLAKLTYLIWNHREEIRHIETVRGYTFGSHYFVEVHIVLAEDMSLSQSHNIGQSLKYKLEQLPEVERAFVHIDVDNGMHPLENKPKKPSSSP
ncbi:Metal tolerance protein 9 [Hibiscus syriacus]|uniref:Metal tolerance protein 9 n=1 Tax=Hibiscus syriacus TaxID=106335 RepID=A0A6A2YA07_HIBSY|nr:metal tolerance protein 9-like [Hibiscus syriacus]KAE8679205.1 Metal tolerance protein 9 [Hibiscus syriacus]